MSDIPIEKFIEELKEKGITVSKTNMGKITFDFNPCKISIGNLPRAEINKIVRQFKIEKLKELISLLQRKEKLIKFVDANPDALMNVQKGDELRFSFNICFEFI